MEKLIGVKLDAANFTGEKPDLVKVTPVGLADVNVTREKLVGVKLTREELDGANVTDVNPALAKFTGAYFTGVKPPPVGVVVNVDVDVAAPDVAALELGSVKVPPVPPIGM
jgi:uncharacterized protein YjbI with pentapeptide repeats